MKIQMFCCVYWQRDTDFTEKQAASIITLEHIQLLDPEHGGRTLLRKAQCAHDYIHGNLSLRGHDYDILKPHNCAECYKLKWTTTSNKGI
jgi:hypothetical protein